MSEQTHGPNTADWRDDPANAWCKVCDRGLEGCAHESADPEHAAPESAPDQAGTTGTKNHTNGRSER